MFYAEKYTNIESNNSSILGQARCRRFDLNIFQLFYMWQTTITVEIKKRNVHFAI